MPDFHASIAQHTQISDSDLKKAGQATGKDMDEKHKKFLADVIGMRDRLEIDPAVPSSFLNENNYGKLSDEQKDHVSLALMNMADEIRHIEWYFRSKTTPNASPQLQTMIEHLWDKKSRLEEQYGDILKF